MNNPLDWTSVSAPPNSPDAKSAKNAAHHLAPAGRLFVMTPNAFLCKLCRQFKRFLPLTPMLKRIPGWRLESVGFSFPDYLYAFVRRD